MNGWQMPLIRLTLFGWLATLVWLGIEYHLGGLDIRPSLLPWHAGVIAGLVMLLAISVQPRVSMIGEAKLATEMIVVAAFALMLLPAAIFLLYALGLGLSAVMAAASWVLWAVLFVLAWVVQILIWALTIGGAIFGIIGVLAFFGTRSGAAGGAAVGGLVAYFLGVALSSLMGSLIGRSSRAVRDGALASSADDTGWIPSATFLAEWIRGTVVSLLDLTQALNLLINALGAIVVTLGVALLLRRLRQSLMSRPKLRPYIPGGAAPVSNSLPWINAQLVKPAAFWLTAAWIVTLVSTVYR